MDFKALRAKRNDKARSLIESSGGKVDASTWTPDEKLDADVKTGMRPISRRAFKTGGKVDGEAAKTNLSRAPRGGISEKVGLANTDQKAANEEREGKKHVGGFKKGGRIGKEEGGLTSSPIPKKRPDDLGITQAGLDSTARGSEGEDTSMQKSPIPKKRPDDLGIDPKKVEEDTSRYYKKGGKIEGSAKDKAEDKVMAKKAGVSMKKWEKSDADKEHDEGCTCKACGGRMARATGGRTKGKTNIVINVMPHTANKPAAGIQPPMPPMPPVGGPPPMGGMPPAPPPHMSLPPGLGAAMAGAAGAPPAPPGAGPVPPMMARKSGGKVYPIHTGSGGGQARLDKIKAYGLKQK